MTCIVTWALAEDYSRPTKRGQYQYVSGVIGISYTPFLNSEAGAAYMKFEVMEKPSLGFLLQKVPENISVTRSERKVELRFSGEDYILSTNLGTFWVLLRPSWCPHPQQV